MKIPRYSIRNETPSAHIALLVSIIRDYIFLHFLLLQQSDSIPLTAMVLSAVFWPAFREEKLKVAEDVQRYINLWLCAYY